MTYEVDAIGLLAREVLRERTAELVAEACAWAVGLSDRAHHTRRHGRVVATGVTVGTRVADGLPLSGEEDARLELGEARPGTFRDALNALTPDGRLYADRFEDEVLVPFVVDTCVRAVERARRTQPLALSELLDELGEDGDDVVELVHAADWVPPLTTEAEHLALAALGDVPLVQVEAEGLPLSLVHAAEAATRAATPAPELPAAPVREDELAGALFLAETAIGDAGLPSPVPPAFAERLLDTLLGEGLEPDEVLRVLPHLTVEQDTAEEVGVLLEARFS
jgi:hypothetical protein